MSRARDVAFIRSLCKLDVPSQTLVRSLLPALRTIVPAHSAGVFWVDEQGEMTALYAERLLPPDAMARYHERHAGSAEGFAVAFRRRASASSPVSARSFTAAEQRGDYFRDVLKPLDAYHVLYGVVGDAGRPVAQLSLYRGANDKPFDARSQDDLASVLRYLGPALARAHVSPGTEGILVEEALGVVSRDGDSIGVTHAWLRMTRLLALSRVAPRSARGEAATIKEFLARTCAEMLPLPAPGKPSPESAASVVDSPWGRHVMRAYRLADVRGRRGEQVGLLIRREEPTSLALVRGSGATALSPQQREVALLIAQGKSNPEIAEALGLTLNTASYHVKQVFSRLEVRERGDVSVRLLNLAQSTLGC